MFFGERRDNVTFIDLNDVSNLLNNIKTKTNDFTLPSDSYQAYEKSI